MSLAGYIPRWVSVELYSLNSAEISVFVPNEASFCVRYCLNAGEGVLPYVSFKTGAFSY